MAYTKILVIHNRLDKCVDYTQNEEKTSLEAAIDYALNREKTERTCYETAVNCDRETVYADMMDTKRRWSKGGRARKGYHVIQSFPPGEVTPEEAHTVGVEFAQRLFGERYEVIVSTHLNKAHLHNHVVVNSVSFVDGRMYRDQLKDYFGGDGVGIRGTSDAICMEHGLPIIDPTEPLKGPVSRAELEAARKGKPTVRGLIRQDIDAALAGAYTMKSFWQRLAQMGYTVKHGSNIKHAAIRPAWGKGNIRLDSLGGGLRGIRTFGAAVRRPFRRSPGPRTVRAHCAARAVPMADPRTALPYSPVRAEPSPEAERLSRPLLQIPVPAGSRLKTPSESSGGFFAAGRTPQI